MPPIPTLSPSIDTEEEAAAAGEQARGQGSDAIDVIDDTNAQERDDSVG